MSKKVLKLAGRQPMLLALIVMATFTLALLFSGWLTPMPIRAQPRAADSQPNVEATNCVIFSTSTTCSEGSMNFGPSSVSDCGLPITVSVSLTNIAGQAVTDTTYTNAGDSGSNACPDSYTISTNAPAIVSESWADSDGGIGPGLSDKFFPTNQSGSVSFTVVWQHVCDANYITNTTTVPYTIPCPAITGCTVLSAGDTTGRNTGAKIGYYFGCTDGWYSWESIAQSTNTCGTQSYSSLTNATLGVDWSGADPGGGDKIYDPNPPGASCVNVTQQTIYFALVGGGGTTNDNSTCSFPNTQTITVTQTNAPNIPAHGIVTVTVTIGGGTTATYPY